MSFFRRQQPREEADATITKRDRLEVVTPPGQETGTVTEPTKEIPFQDRTLPKYEGEIQHLRDQVSDLKQQQQQQAPSTESTIDQLKQLGELRQSGVLTEAEFEAEKAKILGNQ